MSAKRTGLTEMRRQATGGESALTAGSAEQRDALRGRRGDVDVDKLSDEEVRILWTSLSPQARAKYLDDAAELRGPIEMPDPDEGPRAA